MKLMRVLLCAAVLGAFSVPAVAGPAKGKKARAAKVAKKAKKTKRAAKADKRRVKKYEFLGDELEGEIGAPDGDRLFGRTGASFTSLIKVRTTFLPEVTKAAENL